MNGFLGSAGINQSLPRFNADSCTLMLRSISGAEWVCKSRVVSKKPQSAVCWWTSYIDSLDVTAAQHWRCVTDGRLRRAALHARNSTCARCVRLYTRNTHSRSFVFAYLQHGSALEFGVGRLTLPPPPLLPTTPRFASLEDQHRHVRSLRASGGGDRQWYRVHEDGIRRQRGAAVHRAHRRGLQGFAGGRYRTRRVCKSTAVRRSRRPHRCGSNRLLLF